MVLTTIEVQLMQLSDENNDDDDDEVTDDTGWTNRAKNDGTVDTDKRTDNDNDG